MRCQRVVPTTGNERPCQLMDKAPRGRGSAFLTDTDKAPRRRGFVAIVLVF